jgi:hypothetical protein
MAHITVEKNRNICGNSQKPAEQGRILFNDISYTFTVEPPFAERKSSETALGKPDTESVKAPMPEDY